MAVSINGKRNGVTEIRNAKRMKKEFCPDVLELILKKLNFLDLTNSKLVCSSWNSIAKHVQTCYLPDKKAPFLMIPPLINGHNFSLYDIVGKRNYNFKTNMGFAYSEESCYEIGSSHGCLIFLDKKFVPFVLNPLTGSKLELPKFTDGKVIFTNVSPNVRPAGGTSLHRISTEGKSPTQSWLRNEIVRKVILSSDPFGGNKFSAALIYFIGALAYFNVGQDAWTTIEAGIHSDVIFHENKLYAYNSFRDHVEFWDFSGNLPVKLMEVKCPIKQLGLERVEFDKLYLAKLSERILLVTRTVADIKIGSKEKYRYRTRSFDVFELDMEEQQWVEVESLEGCAIFLGGNHTMSVPTHQQEFASLEEGSIYFTDDSWYRMCKNSDCGGHDRGVFDTRNRKVKECDDYGFCMIKPSPSWIVASPW